MEKEQTSRASICQSAWRKFYKRNASLGGSLPFYRRCIHVNSYARYQRLISIFWVFTLAVRSKSAFGKPRKANATGAISKSNCTLTRSNVDQYPATSIIELSDADLVWQFVTLLDLSVRFNRSASCANRWLVPPTAIISLPTIESPR